MRQGAEHPETNHAGRGVLLMLGGVVMGAAVGLLTAPQSGERTRRQIVRKAEDVKDQATELYGNVAESVEGLRRGVRRNFEAGKKYIDKTRQGLVIRPRGLRQPVSRLIDTLRGVTRSARRLLA
jgi:YtxH-like protein